MPDETRSNFGLETAGSIVGTVHAQRVSSFYLVFDKSNAPLFSFVSLLDTGLVFSCTL